MREQHLSRHEIGQEQENTNYDELTGEIFREVEPIFLELVTQLKKEIDSGAYIAIIADDVSGRLPALVLREVVKERCGVSPSTFFLPGEGGSYGEYERELLKSPQNKKLLENIAHSLRNRQGKRSLLITESTESGETLKNLSKVLASHGIYPDVAALVSWKNKADLGKNVSIGFSEKLARLLGDRRRKVAIGNVGRSMSLIASVSDALTGVAKLGYETKVDYSKHSKGWAPLDRRETMDSARKNVKILAHKILSDVFGKNDSILY